MKVDVHYLFEVYTTLTQLAPGLVCNISVCCVYLKVCIKHELVVVT